MIVASAAARPPDQPRDEIAAWSAADLTLAGTPNADAAHHIAYRRRSGTLIARLPPKSRRSEAEAAALIRRQDRASRERFLRSPCARTGASLLQPSARREPGPVLTRSRPPV
ncbi:MAG: hypothetical protein IRZ13_17815 [Acetobacteraceae bacterium]|nr:hypothetical protein [Acetobacteraceae bacterium]